MVLDYILIDPVLLHTITDFGYEPFGNHIISDHRGIYMDINTSRCFSSTIQPLLPLQLRNLSTRRSHQIVPYFQQKLQHLEDHSWFKRIQQLQQDMDNGTPNNALAEDLYGRLISASQHAG